MGPPELPGGNIWFDAPIRAGQTVLQWGRRNYPAETCAAPGRCGATSARFNGAAGITRRKPLSDLAAEVIFFIASMGPPELPGGNGLQHGLQHRHRLGLQWGRRNYPAETTALCPAGETRPRSFNGAAGITRRKRELVRVHQQQHRSAASMGPPELPGGNLDAGDQPVAGFAYASMGPPELPGGNYLVPRPISPAASLLQWGRRNYPAETAVLAVAAPWPRRRFNGAAGITRRKPP